MVAAAAVDSAAAAVAGAAAAFPTDAERQAGGFGVRVIHSGVWGFASSPIVTEDEIRRITQDRVEVAKASAIAKKTDVRLRRVPAVRRELRDADGEEPDDGSADGQQAWCQAHRRQGQRA